MVFFGEQIGFCLVQLAAIEQGIGQRDDVREFPKVAAKLIAGHLSTLPTNNHHFDGLFPGPQMPITRGYVLKKYLTKKIRNVHLFLKYGVALAAHEFPDERDDAYQKMKGHSNGTISIEEAIDAFIALADLLLYEGIDNARGRWQQWMIFTPPFAPLHPVGHRAAPLEDDDCPEPQKNLWNTAVVGSKVMDGTVKYFDHLMGADEDEKSMGRHHEDAIEGVDSFLFDVQIDFMREQLRMYCVQGEGLGELFGGILQGIMMERAIEMWVPEKDSDGDILMNEDL